MADVGIAAVRNALVSPAQYATLAILILVSMAVVCFSLSKAYFGVTPDVTTMGKVSVLLEGNPCRTANAYGTFPCSSPNLFWYT